MMYEFVMTAEDYHYAERFQSANIGRAKDRADLIASSPSFPLWKSIQVLEAGDPGQIWLRTYAGRWIQL